MQTLLWGLLFVGGSVALAIMGLLWVRRTVPLSFLETHHEVAGFFIGVLGVIYAVLLAFVVIVVWEQHEEARITADREAAELADLFWMAQGFPDPQQQRMQDLTHTYAQFVVDEEWAAMARGEVGIQAQAALDDLRQIYWEFEPDTIREAALYAESLTRLNDMTDSRRERLLASRTGVLPIMWTVLVTGGILTVVFTYFFGVKSIRSQTLMTAALTATIALVLFLIFTINYPFSGDVRVSSESFDQVLERMETMLRR